VTSTNTRSFSTWTISTNSAPSSNMSSDTLNIVANAIGNITVRADWADGTYPSVTCPSAPTRNGYTFNGWFTAASAGTKRCDANGSYTPSATETLHAQWSGVTYNIVVESNGGGSVSNQTYTTASSTQTRTLVRPTAPSGTTRTVSFNSQ
jgi:uncharacterized repeat protein (TIGR02543 family)